VTTIPTGTPSNYRKGCRCPECREAQRRYSKRYRLRSQTRGGSTLADAADAALILRDLSTRMSLSAIARAIGTSHAWVRRVIRGEIKRISPERAEAINQLRSYHPADKSRVTTLAAQRRLQALHAIGYTWASLAAETGLTTTAIKDIAYGEFQYLNARNDQVIRSVYERLCMTVPTGATPHHRAAITAARNASTKRGWAPPLAWDNIDNPTEHPKLDAHTDTPKQDTTDHAVIQRVIDTGIKPRQLTYAEAAEVTRRLTRSGLSSYDLRERYGLRPTRYKGAS